MPRALTFTPYLVSGNLELHIAKFEDLTTNAVQHYPHTSLNMEGLESEYDLSGDGWVSLRLFLEATLPHKALEELLPPGSDPAEDTLLIVTLSCPATKTRRAILLESSGKGRWHGTADMHRLNVKNVVSVRPRLVRRNHAPAATVPVAYATKAASIIAEGQEVRLVVDRGKQPFKGGLDVRWEDFQGSESAWRKAHANALFSLSADGDEPVLWLNSRHSRLRGILHSNEEAGSSRVMKNLLLAIIAESVWYQLSFAAIVGLERDEETNEVNLPSGWRGMVISRLLPYLYPDVSADAQYSQLLEDLESEAAAAALSTRLSAAVQEQTNTPTLVRQALSKVDFDWYETAESVESEAL